MEIENPLKRLKAPCARCPYKLGLVRAVVNPCPQCKDNGYAMFEQFQKRNYPPLSREKG
ncbi:MAG: hypothetical protein IKN96_06880 [Oscillibacter sp.]|nr:hypothetical protein [Oscillibacter sp.]